MYGDTREALPHDVPIALGSPVIMIHYVDANLYRNILTGRSVTGILHFLNKIHIDLFSNKQATSETAIYGSGFIVARTCVEQIIDLRTTLKYLSVRIIVSSYIFGDNESVVLTSMRFTNKLHKRLTVLSFHQVRDSITAGIYIFHYLPGE